MEIIGNVKNYDWGKLGSNSVVAKLAILNDNQNFAISEETPYAELWMGDHVSGPAKIKTTQELLGTRINKNLPFLLKVLSIRKALSIQVHPNKTEAERLHKERPDVYKDPNHKPELAIALTPFLALCGFRPYEEIWNFCDKLPPLKAIVGGDENVVDLKNADGASGLRKCYEKLMTTDESTVAQCIEEIIKNYKQVLTDYNLLDVFNTINQDFPNDVGLLSLFFLNLLRLQPGDAIFLAANEIHAYLSGDCVECMACSDNVIRAGLTPKYKDVGQLISCLNYVGSPPSTRLFQARSIDDNFQLFSPPVKDFAVAKVCLKSTMTKNYCLQLGVNEAILLVLQGERRLQLKDGKEIQLKRGSIIFIPADAANDLKFLTAGSAVAAEDFIGYIATKNDFQ